MSFAAEYIFCQIVRVLPDYIFYPAKPSFQTIRRYPHPHPDGNLSISIHLKTQLHLSIKIPKTPVESSFPHEQHHGLNMRWDGYFILHGKRVGYPFHYRVLCLTFYPSLEEFHPLYPLLIQRLAL